MSQKGCKVKPGALGYLEHGFLGFGRYLRGCPASLWLSRSDVFVHVFVLWSHLLARKPAHHTQHSPKWMSSVSSCHVAACHTSRTASPSMWDSSTFPEVTNFHQRVDPRVLSAASSHNGSLADSPGQQRSDCLSNLFRRQWRLQKIFWSGFGS